MSAVNDWFRAELRSKSTLVDSLVHKDFRFEIWPETNTKEIRARISRRYFFEVGLLHD